MSRPPSAWNTAMKWAIPRTARWGLSDQVGPLGRHVALWIPAVGIVIGAVSTVVVVAGYIVDTHRFAPFPVTHLNWWTALCCAVVLSGLWAFLGGAQYISNVAAVADVLSHYLPPEQARWRLTHFRQWAAEVNENAVGEDRVPTPRAQSVVVVLIGATIVGNACILNANLAYSTMAFSPFGYNSVAVAALTIMLIPVLALTSGMTIARARGDIIQPLDTRVAPNTDDRGAGIASTLAAQHVAWWWFCVTLAAALIAGVAGVIGTVITCVASVGWSAHLRRRFGVVTWEMYSATAILAGAVASVSFGLCFTLL